MPDGGQGRKGGAWMDLVLGLVNKISAGINIFHGPEQRSGRH